MVSSDVDHSREPHFLDKLLDRFREHGPIGLVGHVHAVLVRRAQHRLVDQRRADHGIIVTAPAADVDAMPWSYFPLRGLAQTKFTLFSPCCLKRYGTPETHALLPK